MWNKNAVKTHHNSVTYPRCEPSFPRPVSLSHTQKSRALCSVAAEVQMVCLYASLTHRCSFTSSLLRLLLLDSVHQCSTSVTPLSFALLSLHTLFLFSPLRNLSLCPLFIIVSIFRTHDLLSLCSAPWPSLAHPDEWVILLHCTQPSLSMFDNGSFDSFLPVFNGWQRLRAGSHAVIIKSMSTAKPQSLQVIKTLQLRVTSSQSLVFSCPTFWLENPQSLTLPVR